MSFQISNDNLTLSDFNPSSSNVVIGQNSGVGLNCVSIGNNAGSKNQGINCVAIGLNAGSNNQALRSVAIGEGSGSISQGTLSVSIGTNAGNNIQANWAVAVGSETAVYNQGLGSVAIGHYSGWNNQSNGCVSIGRGSGQATQGQGAIAIGYLAGNASQGANAIAIGNSAGKVNQHVNSIILNASGFDLNSATQGSFYVNPIRSTSGTSGGVFYDSSTKELTYSSTKSFIIEHPIESNKYLVHACLEGPEAGVYYRGKSEITNDDSVEIVLPEYTRTFSDFTVQITPLCNNSNNIITYGSSDVVDGKFTVYGKNGKFFWIVNALRQSIITEPLKEETEVRGDGPYKYVVN